MRLLLLCLAAACVVSAADPVARAVVNRPVLNMFSKPTEDTDVVSQAIFGTNVEVLETTQGWCRVRTPDAYTGWIQAIYLLPGEQPYASGGDALEVISLFAHVYREKSVTKHQPLVTVPFETRLEKATGSDDRWFEVTLPDKRSGWVQRGDVAPVRAQPMTLDAVAALSHRFLGLPYTWGGTSSFGYDCSGFTQMLMRRRGVHMPRDAHQQAAWEGVVPVKDGLASGDLLFFGPSEEKITHTGMYIGHGEFIHASTHERPVVQIGRLDDPHWAGLLVATRRAK